MKYEQLNEYEQLIDKALDQYEQAVQAKSVNMDRKKKQLDGYILEYETLAEDDDSLEKLQRFKRQKEEIKKQGIRSTKKNVGNGLDLQHPQANQVFIDMNRKLEQGITIGEQVQAELHGQIQALDKLYEENKKAQAKLSRIKMSLQTMWRRIYKDKLTCCLIVMLILAIIALIVVSVVLKKV